ncbi:MAG: LL-diaminopimelate aminotransferase [Oscillospiraceae bacterium]|nr:LL-diaminopimelate aminotransferase [Oscillospiraceae bacterium]MBR3556932.1 LL-diaminopimelate aminotransferase [Oscillospiraceae bacterium]
MLTPNPHYGELQDSYLFARIAEKTAAWLRDHPGERLLRMGIGDVSQPLCPAVIRALHEAVEDQARGETFRGYLPECGAPFLREAIARHYARRGVELSPEEVFVSSGASDELGHILDLFDPSSPALIPEPAYPAYVDASVLAGRRILHLPTGREGGFLPEPPEKGEADLIYLCSPNNPTGAVLDRERLKAWVDWADRRGAVILFDAAYEAFIQDPALPHSIFEIEGARTCAIEICSLSKTAGFTGTRLGYTIIPRELRRGGMSLSAMWVRNRTTKSNGVSYILQRGGAAVFTEEGQRQVQDTLRIYRENARIMGRTLDRLGIWYTGGRNAPYIWMQCPGEADSWSFFDRLLKEIQVVGTPGEGFGACGEGYFRFSAFGSPEDTREAMGRLEGLLQ